MQLHLKMARPTPMKDAAVNRLAKSITQLTLEVDAATKLLDKAFQKLQGIQNIPSQRSLTLKLPYANFAKLTAFWIVAQFPLVTKLAKRRKPYYCFRIQPKGRHIIGRAQCTNIATLPRQIFTPIFMCSAAVA